MSELYSNLKSSEKDLLLKAPLLVGMLIAGADGIIDSKEQKRLSNSLYVKARKHGNELEELYQKLIDNLNIYLIDFMHTYPRDADERNREIVKKLGELNEILSKLDKSFAHNYYQNLRFVARRTAKASGGYFGLGGIGKKEKKFIMLTMILDPGLPQSEKKDQESYK